MTTLFGLLFTLFFQTIPDLEKSSFFSFYQADQFYIVNKDSVFVTKNGTETIKWKHNITWPHLNFNALQNNKSVFLISEGGGVVYEFKDQKFERIDQSFEHRNKYYSYDFLYQDKIHSYGGYGLFNSNDNITFFDAQSKEWAEFIYHPDSPVPIERRQVLGQLSDHKLFIGGGVKESSTTDLKNTRYIIDDFWVLDLKSHVWYYLGQSIFLSNLVDSNFLEKKLRTISYKDGCLLIYDLKVFWLDIKNNLLNELNVNTPLLENIKHLNYSPNTDTFLITVSNHETGKERFIVTSSADLIGETISSKKLYIRAQQTPIYYIITAIALLIGLLYFRRRRYSRDYKSILIKNRDKIKLRLGKEEFKILQYILDQSPKGVQFPQILEFYEPQLSYESRIKKLRLALDHIEVEINKFNSSSETLLVYEKNKDDKRIKEVRLRL
jgi:hypothetical protein